MQNTNYRPYLLRLFTIFGALLALNLASFGAFLYNPKAFYFRAWEYLPEIAYRFAEYEPVWDQTETFDQTRQNFFYYQDQRHMFVSVDEHGYRSTPPSAGGYDILVSGDSAVFGTSLSDDETFPWVLAEMTGRAVLNGGRSSLFNTLKRPDVGEVELVVDMRSEREIRGSVFNYYGLSPDAPYEPQLRNDKKLYELPTVVSEQRFLLTSIAIRQIGRILNDVRVFFSGGPKRQLFRRHTFQAADLDAAVAAIVERNDQIRERGLEYMFIGIPAKQTLYHAKIEPYTRGYLDALTKRLEAEGVDTVNLLGPFVADRDRGLYHNYDTHWNANGARLAAEIVAEHLAGRKDAEQNPLFR